MFRNRVDRTENAARLSKLNFKIELRNKGSFEPFSSEDAAEDTDEHKAVNIEEQEIPILPDVPEDTFDDGTEISDLDPDADLQRGLTRLKFFNKVWCPAATPTPAPICPGNSIAENIFDANTSDPKVMEETVPVYSTEVDRLQFNQWYNNHLDNASKDSKGMVMYPFTISKVGQQQMATSNSDF